MTTKLLLFIALSALGMSAGIAADQVRVALYFAANTPPPAEATVAPEKLAHGLHQLFGFKHYQLVKAEEIELSHDWDHWVMPRKDFFICVKPMPRKPGEPKIVDYDIYQNGFIVADGKYEPATDTPLFLKGPDFKNGLLIFVFEAR